MTIKLLAPDVAAKIAAGEVVERPANVVKELLENSLDAGATDIRVEVREGGQRLLRVIDNGHGIPEDEVALAFQRHATSKLETAEQLTHIGTFGFRGEALYSVAAVSRLTLTTRHRDQEYGTQIRLEGGEVASQGRAGAPVGTVVTVEQLFFNVPARRKFLRQPATEAGRVSSVVQNFALAYPGCRFSFVNENRLLFQTAGSGDLRDVLTKVYGLENARQMVPVGRFATGVAAAGLDTALTGRLEDEVDFTGWQQAPSADVLGDDEVAVSGYVSLPTLTRANRSQINLFINRRYVEDRNLTYAVVQAYHTLLPGGRYPLAVLFVDVPPAEVDVNVHPQKTQVRLVHERKIFGAVQKAIRRVVVEHAAIPDLDLDATPPANPVSPLPPADTGWSMRRDLIVNAGHQQSMEIFVPPAAGTPLSPPPPAAPPSGPGELPADRPAAPAQAPLEARSRTLPPLRVVGQVGAMYIVTEGPEGMYLIDQHAAHERILYEKFMAQRYGLADGQVARQHLLEPLTLHVGVELTGLVAQHLTTLDHVGFEIEPFGGDTYLVRAVPAVLAGEDPLRSLEEMVQTLGDRRNVVEEELEARLVKMVCKRAAIKAGQQLSVLEMRELIHQLETCQSPRTCPHGRPTMIQLSAGELEKAFGRV